MQVESHIPIHREEVAQRGRAVINGVTFTRGEGGVPTATGVHEDQLRAFTDVEGFVFRHDDGAYVGASAARKDTRPDTRDHLAQALADGNATPELLIALGSSLPTIGAPEPTPEPTPEPEPDLDALTVPKLKALCRDRGLTFGPGATKADLIALLTGPAQ